MTNPPLSQALLDSTVLYPRRCGTTNPPLSQALLYCTLYLHGIFVPALFRVCVLQRHSAAACLTEMDARRELYSSVVYST